MTFDAFIQAGLTAFACGAIILLGRKDRWQRWGYIVGMAGQPFWFWSSVSAGQWGVFAVSCVFTVGYAQGIWNYWIRRPSGPAHVEPGEPWPRGKRGRT